MHYRTVGNLGRGEGDVGEWWLRSQAWLSYKYQFKSPSSIID